MEDRGGSSTRAYYIWFTSGVFPQVDKATTRQDSRKKKAKEAKKEPRNTQTSPG